MRITLHNIQAIDDYTFDFDSHGIIEFKGDNSNGKSILRRVLDNIVTARIFDKVQRSQIIRDGCSEAFVQITTEFLDFRIDLGIERKECSYSFRDDETKPWTNLNFSDLEGYRGIIKRLGFNVVDGGRTCVQLHCTDGTVLFGEHCPPEVNCEVIETITKDEFALACLDNYNTITQPISNRYIKMLTKDIEETQRKIDNYPSYDTTGYDEMIKDIDELLPFADIKVPVFKKPNALKLLNIPEIKPVKVMTLRLLSLPNLKKPNVQKLRLLESVSLKKPNTRRFKLLNLPNIVKPRCKINLLHIPDIKNVSGLINELVSLRNMVCPVCGRQLIDNEHSCV